MSDSRQPQWHSGIDRWVLIIGAGLAVVAGVGVFRSLRNPPTTPTPVPTAIAEVTTLPASPAAAGTELPATAAAGEATPVATGAAPTIPPPSLPEAAEVANLDQGAVLIAEAPSAISGVAPPGATVTVSEDGAVLAQTTADASGNWQLDLPALPPGQHELSVAATGADGQPLGEPQTVAVAAVPAASVTAPIINAPAAAPNEGETTTLSGVAPPGATVTVYEGDAILGETTADANGNWSLELPALAAGEHTIEATATDASGQPLGQPTSIALTVEPQPVAAGEGTPAAVEQTPTEAASSAPTSAAPEATAVAVESTPVAGATETPAEATPAVAVTPPLLLSSLGSPLKNSRPTLRGVAAPGSEVVLFEGDQRLGETKAGERGNWLVSPDKPLPPGEHQLRIEITAPGAEQPVVVDANIIISDDAIALTPPRIERPRRSRLGVGNSLSGRAPAGTTVEILAGEEVIGTVKAGSRGRWNLRLPVTLPAGEYSFRVVVRSAEGEVLAESAPITIAVINTGPPKLLPPTGGRLP